jgi:hypothetical protein
LINSDKCGLRSMRAPVTVTRKEVNISTYDERMAGRDLRPGASPHRRAYPNDLPGRLD